MSSGGGGSSGHRQVSHPRHARPKHPDRVGGGGGSFKEDSHNPKNDRGWGGAGAVGWGVLGAFGSLEKDTAAQVARKGTHDPNVKMVKNEKGLWVKVRVEPGGGGGRGRGGGIPALGGEFGSLQEGRPYDDKGEEYEERDDDGMGQEGGQRKRSDSLSSSSSRSSSPRDRRRHRFRSRSREHNRDRSSSRDKHRGQRSQRGMGREERCARSLSPSEEEKRQGRRQRERGHSRSRSRSQGRGRERDQQRRRDNRERKHRSRSGSKNRKGRWRSRSGSRIGARERGGGEEEKRKGRDDSPGERWKRKENSSRNRGRSSSRSSSRNRSKEGNGRKRRPQSTSPSCSSSPSSSFPAAVPKARGRRADNDRKEKRQEEEEVKKQQQDVVPSSVEMSFTAAQLADRLVEVYNGRSSRRFDALADCFTPDVSLCVLKTNAAVIHGAQPLTASMPAEYAKQTAHVTRRLFITTDLPEDDPSFSLDFYPAGQGPGMNAFGKGNAKMDTILLFQANPGDTCGNKISQVWIAPDREGVASRGREGGRVTEEDVVKSKVFRQVLEVVQGKVKGELRFYMHDYVFMDTIG